MELFRMPNPRLETCYATEISNQEVKYQITFPILAKFDESDLYFTDKSPQFKTGYARLNPFVSDGNSQVSLLMLETYFLSRHVPSPLENLPPSENVPYPSENERPIVVYAGTIPGDHINFLVEWFPFVDFHLYDKRSDRTSDRASAERVSSDKIRPARNVFKVDELLSVPMARAFKTQHSNRVVYFISDIRNVLYSKSKDSKKDSKILDEDMELQLKLAQALDARFSLMRFRPKHPQERETFSEYLSDHTNESNHSLYFRYPIGRILKIPFPRSNQSSMFIITNQYEPQVNYYHDDMLSLIDHHNRFIRTVMLYNNPDEDNLPIGFLTPSSHSALQYSCGVGWDHRAIVFILRTYIKYMGEEPDNDKVMELFLKPFIAMNEKVQEELTKSEPTRTSMTEISQETI